MLPENAPICCVIPPASPAATLVFLNASKSVVLPWSTCPRIVTTGARRGQIWASFGEFIKGLLYAERGTEVVFSGEFRISTSASKCTDARTLITSSDVKVGYSI